jgi:hypothetical protein
MIGFLILSVYAFIGASVISVIKPACNDGFLGRKTMRH